MEETNKVQMRKRNMKQFPTYKKISWDYLFYYTIDFLFLTQVKNISAANVVLLSSIKALCGIFIQIPANIIVDFLGRKNSVILGNILNCLYLVIFMMSGSLFDLIIAKFISSLACSIKDIAEPSLLNASIPPSRYKSNIFAKINAKGTSRIFYFKFYYKNKTNVKKQLSDIEEGFKYVLKSERLKALIIAASLIASLLSILVNYRTSLLQDIKMPASFMGIISALLSFSSAYACKKQNDFHNRYRNKSIIIMALMISVSTILAGIIALKAEGSTILIMIIIALYLFTKYAHGMFYAIIDRYFRNFTNKNIDTKVFATKNLFVNTVSAVMGILASFLLDKMQTAYCMIVIGVAFTILYILMGTYMKTRVGLKPEQYSKEERKYDELKEGLGDVPQSQKKTGEINGRNE